MSGDEPTIFEHIMAKMHGATADPGPSILVAGDMMLFYQPAPMPELKVEWPKPSDWLADLLHARPRHDGIIQIVWPEPRRMACGKWRAAGKVYRTKALAWRSLEKRGLRP